MWELNYDYPMWLVRYRTNSIYANLKLEPQKNRVFNIYMCEYGVERAQF